MIQDLDPLVFHNEYRDFVPEGESLVIAFAEEKILVRQKDGGTFFPRCSEFNLPADKYYYLFSIAEDKYFLPLADGEDLAALSGKEASVSPAGDAQTKSADETTVGDAGKAVNETAVSDTGKAVNKRTTGPEYAYVPVGAFREMQPRHTAFAAVTAHQIYRWQADNRFCGRCGRMMIHDQKERMLRCPDCGNLVYPRISPAVIVGLVDGDRILMTRYASREYKRYALVAGFAEVGETLEQTVAREVMEEVGLRVKNIRYYKSQPWSFSASLLSGFFAQLDGGDEIILDEDELAEAVWFRRGEIPVQDDGISLTREMIQAFADNRLPAGFEVGKDNGLSVDFAAGQDLLFFTPVDKQLVWGSESWTISAHTHGDCQVSEGSLAGKTLSELWRQRPDLFGGSGKGEFPLLVKIIDAREDLSIQVHPDDAYAGEHENGSRGKTECWYILECKADAALVLGHNAADQDRLAAMIANRQWEELLREVPVKPGDFLQIEPGTVHAIKGGIKLLEIQQSSDITYRLYDYNRLSQGKPRELHIRQSLDVITAPDPALTERFRPARRCPANVRQELVSCDYYTVWELVVEERTTIPAGESFYIICVISGDGSIDERSLREGDHFILPYGYGEATLQGRMKLILAAARS